MTRDDDVGTEFIVKASLFDGTWKLPDPRLPAALPHRPAAPGGAHDKAAIGSACTVSHVVRP